MKWLGPTIILASGLLFTSCSTSKPDSLSTSKAPSSQKHEGHSKDSDFEQGYALLYSPSDRADYAKAVTFLSDALKTKKNDAKARLALIYALTKRNRYNEAEPQIKSLNILRQELSKKDNLWANALEAKVYQRHDQELMAWQALTDQYPEDRWAWYELGAAHYVRGDYAETTMALERALAVEPENEAWHASYIHYIKSKSHYRVGQYADSITAAEPGLIYPPTQRATYYRKVMAKLALGQSKDPESDLQKYRKISQAEGKSESTILAGISSFFFEAGAYAKALKYAQASFDLEEKAFPAVLIGYSLTENGELTSGLQAQEKTISLFPDNSSAHAAKGWSLYRLGRYEEARSSYMKARSLRTRTHFGMENDLNLVVLALSDPNAKVAPPRRWFGD